MKRTSIFILCLGGQGASVLARTFNKCGMEFGNGNTFWDPTNEIPHGEHSLITYLMAELHIAPVPSKEQWLKTTKIREILQSYKVEAEKQDWKCYGIKTSSGICAHKWDGGVSDLFKEEWPDALYFGVIRQPDPFGHMDKGWNSVWVGRKGMVDRGGIFVPFPDTWLNGSIVRIVKAIGLTWNEEALSIFKEPAEEKKWECLDEQKRIYFEKFPEEEKQREYLMKKSEENLIKLESKEKK